MTVNTSLTPEQLERQQRIHSDTWSGIDPAKVRQGSEAFTNASLQLHAIDQKGGQAYRDALASGMSQREASIVGAQVRDDEYAKLGVTREERRPENHQALIRKLAQPHLTSDYATWEARTNNFLGGADPSAPKPPSPSPTNPTQPINPSPHPTNPTPTNPTPTNPTQPVPVSPNPTVNPPPGNNTHNRTLTQPGSGTVNPNPFGGGFNFVSQPGFGAPTSTPDVAAQNQAGGVINTTGLLSQLNPTQQAVFNATPNQRPFSNTAQQLFQVNPNNFGSQQSSLAGQLLRQADPREQAFVNGFLGQ